MSLVKKVEDVFLLAVLCIYLLTWCYNVCNFPVVLFTSTIIYYGKFNATTSTDYFGQTVLHPIALYRSVSQQRLQISCKA
jgi:hypothetical protein